MLESVRVRLTLWYTALLALFLVVLSLATYFLFWRTTVRRSDGNLVELSNAFLTTLQAELTDIDDPDAIEVAAREAILEHRFRGHIFAVLDSTGHVLISTRDLQTIPAEPFPSDLFLSSAFQCLVNSPTQGHDVLQNLAGAKGGYRALARRFSARGRPYTLAIVQSLHPQKEMLEGIREIFAWVIPLALLLAGAGGYFLARKSLAPVVAMSAQAKRIGAENLHERLPVSNAKDELGQLAGSFNQLLERVDQSFERQRRFMSDASHELRTPVAILRGESEVALSQSVRSPEEYRESLSVLHSEAKRLTRIVEDLFTLTRADAGEYPLSMREFYLDELCADCVRATRTLASAKSISLACEAAEEVPIHADEALLRRMIVNLLDNAIKYTQADGRIALSCRRDGVEYAVSVTDTGTGIPAALQTRVFERFFRADPARSRSETNGDGAGLGLAIARWIAEAHHGRLVLVRSDATGSNFTAFLPVTLASESPQSPARI